MNSLNFTTEDNKCAYIGDKTKSVPSQDDLNNIRQNFLIHSAIYLGLDTTVADMAAAIKLGKGPLSTVTQSNDYQIM